MSKAPETIACPACGTELTIEQLVAHLDDEKAFSRLVALSVPMAHLVVGYITLFKPEKQALTLRKKVRLIAQLLPDCGARSSRTRAVTGSRHWRTGRAPSSRCSPPALLAGWSCP